MKSEPYKLESTVNALKKKKYMTMGTTNTYQIFQNSIDFVYSDCPLKEINISQITPFFFFLKQDKITVIRFKGLELRDNYGLE